MKGKEQPCEIIKKTHSRFPRCKGHLYPSMDVDFAANVAANEMYESVVEVIESSIYIEVLGVRSVPYINGR